MSKSFDVVVVGSGPNGLAAAIRLQQAGLSVLLLEGKDTVGGGLRSAELTLPGFTHDICSAIHPMAGASPYFKTLPLHEHGLTFVYPEYAAAHPFDDGSAAVLERSLENTAAQFGVDEKRYLSLFKPITRNWNDLTRDILAPFHFPSSPLKMASFGMHALQPATLLLKKFHTSKLRGFLAGMAAHAIQPLSNVATSAIALVLTAAGHTSGWPVPTGGAQRIADALAAYFRALGGKIETGFYVSSLRQLPAARAFIFDVTPRQLLGIAGHRFSTIYRWQLERYRYGMGVFKIDWALDAPIPFANENCRKAGTIHLGNSMEEIAAGESLAARGGHPGKPFVLLAQQSLMDSTRAPAGKHTGWAYCHVPNGSVKDMTAAIENQVERFAPGFRERILARHVMNAAQMEAYNPNYVGGDINGGVIDIGQLFTRPALRYSPYRTSARGLYICSSSTPPGGGVHGMCGFHAAERVLKDIFREQLKR